MKKLSVVLILLIVTVAFGFAEYSVESTDTLNVFGYIGAPASPNFTVWQTSVQTTPIDLVGNTAIHPGGDGVVVGQWNFNGTIQGESVTYRVSYDTTDLTSVLVPGATAIPFSVKEYIDEVENTLISGATYDYTEIVAAPGPNNITREVAVVLDSAIPSAQDPATDYKGTITVSLLAE